MASPDFTADDDTAGSRRSMRSFIKVPERFRDIDDADLSSRRSSVDSMTNPKNRGRPPKTSTRTKRKRSSSLSPPPWGHTFNNYLPSALPSRRPHETQADYLADKKQKMQDSLEQFQDEDDGFGASWSDVEPEPPGTPIIPHSITLALRGRAKRALIADNTTEFLTFYRTQRQEISDITSPIPASIARDALTSALAAAWPTIAAEILDQDAAALGSDVAAIDRRFVRRNEAKDSLSPTEQGLEKGKEKATDETEALAARLFPPKLNPRHNNATKRDRGDLYSALPSPREVSNHGGLAAHEVDVYGEGERRAVSVVTQYRKDWRRARSGPLVGGMLGDLRRVGGLVMAGGLNLSDSEGEEEEEEVV